MKNLIPLTICIIMFLILFSCQKQTHQLDGIWEFKEGTAETYVIKDSISQEIKDSLIKEIKRQRDSYEMSYIYEIENGEIHEGLWNEDDQKYHIVRYKDKRYQLDTITGYTDFELMDNILQIDTLYSVYSEGTGGRFRYVNKNQLEQYTIYEYNEDFGYATLAVITPLTRLKDKSKIEYFNGKDLTQ